MKTPEFVSAVPMARSTQESGDRTAASARKTASRLGVWAAALTALCAASALGLGLVTPAHAGPYCASNCLSYPYAGAAAFVPGDFLWEYPATFMALAFLVLMACLYSFARSEHEVFVRIGMSFTLITTLVITADYFVQLSVVQPSLLKGETEGLALLGQYNPHGIFIALEDLGYLTMSLALLCASAVLNGRSRLERLIRWLYLLAPILTIGAFLVLSFIYGLDLDYRFEVFAIAIDWTTLIVSGILLSVWFRRAAAKEVA